MLVLTSGGSDGLDCQAPKKLESMNALMPDMVLSITLFVLHHPQTFEKDSIHWPPRLIDCWDRRHIPSIVPLIIRTAHSYV